MTQAATRITSKVKSLARAFEHSLNSAIESMLFITLFDKDTLSPSQKQELSRELLRISTCGVFYNLLNHAYNDEKEIFVFCGRKTIFHRTSVPREFDTLKSKIFDRVRSELFFLSNLFYIFVVYISKYRKYETFN